MATGGKGLVAMRTYDRFPVAGSNRSSSMTDSPPL
jgi:hypothetical protein